jgi:hypothetical protein
MDLDDLLDRSAPPTAPRTATLERELHRMVLEAEPAAGRPVRRALRRVVVGGLATAALGVGTGGAMAVGLVPAPDWVPWTPPSGRTCVFQFTVSPVDETSGEPAAGGHTEQDKRLAVAEANRFLGAFDYSSIDEHAAVRRYQAAEDAVIASQPDPSERQPRLTGDDLVISAINREVVQRLHAHLRAKGLEPYAASVDIARSC